MQLSLKYSASELLKFRELIMLYNSVTEDKITGQQSRKKNKVLNQDFLPLQNGQLDNKGELDMGFDEGGQFWIAGKASEGKSIWEVCRETTDPRITSLRPLQSVRSAKWRHKM